MPLYLRTTIFADYEHPPLTTILSEDDLTDTIHSAADRFRTDAARHGGFAITEIVERPEDFQEATIKIVEAIDKRRERNMAVLYFWNAKMMPLMREEGSIYPNANAPNYPAPLDREDIEYTFHQLALHPDTKPSVTVVSHGQDGSRVKLHNGQVSPE